MKFFEVDEKTRQKEQPQGKVKIGKTIKKIYKNVKVPWGRYIFAAVLGIFFYALAGSNTGITAKIASGDFSDSTIIFQYVVVSILGLGTGIAGLALDYANYNLNSRIKSKVWNKVLKLPIKFYDKETPNRIISRITTDTDAALVPFSMAVILLALLGMGLGVLVSAIGNLNTPMAKYLYIGIVIMIILTVVSVVVTIMIGFISASRLAELTAFLSERLSNFKLIKATNSEENELKLAHQLIDNRYKADIMTMFALLLSYVSSYIMTVLGYISCFLLGYNYYEAGLITDGQQLIQFNAFIGAFAALIIFIGSFIASIAGAAGQSHKFASIFDEKEENLEEGNSMPKSTEDIVLSNVGFSYDDSHMALCDISCRIKKGEITAIVGANGSGKSTLIKLIDRLYTDIDGQLLFGDVDAEHISLASWRDRIAIVSQSANLFSGTIRDNICYGVEEYSEAEVASVCRLSGVDEIISTHEEGLDYEIGINGSKLSGGEQQRVSIARAMMKNPDYLILDEATANLDAKTARKVQQSIDNLMEGRTVINIAHSYESIKKADNIIVLKDGKIEANGTHDDLMSCCEFYRKLCQAGFEV